MKLIHLACTQEMTLITLVGLSSSVFGCDEMPEENPNSMPRKASLGFKVMQNMTVKAKSKRKTGTPIMNGSDELQNRNIEEKASQREEYANKKELVNPHDMNNEEKAGHKEGVSYKKELVNPHDTNIDEKAAQKEESSNKKDPVNPHNMNNEDRAVRKEEFPNKKEPNLHIKNNEEKADQKEGPSNKKELVDPHNRNIEDMAAQKEGSANKKEPVNLHNMNNEEKAAQKEGVSNKKELINPHNRNIEEKASQKEGSSNKKEPVNPHSRTNEEKAGNWRKEEPVESPNQNNEEKASNAPVFLNRIVEVDPNLHQGSVIGNPHYGSESLPKKQRTANGFGALQDTKHPREKAHTKMSEGEYLVESGMCANSRKTTAEAVLGSLLFSEVKEAAGEKAPSSANLNLHSIGALEKARFSDVLKRKGGLEGYPKCRNFIMGQWERIEASATTTIDNDGLLGTCGKRDTAMKRPVKKCKHVETETVMSVESDIHLCHINFVDTCLESDLPDLSKVANAKDLIQTKHVAYVDSSAELRKVIDKCSEADLPNLSQVFDAKDPIQKKHVEYVDSSAESRKKVVAVHSTISDGDISKETEKSVLKFEDVRGPLGNFGSALRKDIKPNKIDSLKYQRNEIKPCVIDPKQHGDEGSEMREMVRRLSSVGVEATQQSVKMSELLQDMFSNANTMSGRQIVVQELLKLPCESMRKIAGTMDALVMLNKWVLDSLDNGGTQLLRFCLHLLLLVATDLPSVYHSGLGRTVKEKVLGHQCQNICALANRLGEMWVGLKQREQASQYSDKCIEESNNSLLASKCMVANLKPGNAENWIGSCDDVADTVTAKGGAASSAIEEAYSVVETSGTSQYVLPKILSFRKFAKQEQSVVKGTKKKGTEQKNVDLLDLRDKKPFPAGDEDRKQKVRNWVLDFSSCIPVEWTMNDHVAIFNNPERKGIKSTEVVNDSTFGMNARKNSNEPSGGRSQIAHESFSVTSQHSVQNNIQADGVTIGSRVSSTFSSEARKDNPKGFNIKNAVSDYVSQLLTPLYKTRKLQKDGVKHIHRKTVAKVMERSNELDTIVNTSGFLDTKRKIKIRSLVDKLVEGYMEGRHH